MIGIFNIKKILYTAVFLVISSILNGQNNNDNFGSLMINWMGVLDNEEQSGGIHGPWGNFHVLIYSAQQSCYGSASSYPKPLSSFVVRGPSKNEWDDGDNMYMKVEVFKWRSLHDSVLVFIYESDPSFFIFRRKHDPVFCSVISSDKTSKVLLLYSRYIANKKAIKRAIARGCKVWMDIKTPSLLPELFKSKYNIPKTIIEFETR